MKATVTDEVEEGVRLQLRKAHNEEYSAQLALSEAASWHARARKQTAFLEPKWLEVTEARRNLNRQ